MKLKKITSILAIALTITATSTVFGQGVYAAEKSNASVQHQQTKNNKEKSCRMLDKYVIVQADGTFALKIPDNIKKQIPSSILSRAEAGMKNTNKLIKEGKLVSNSNKTVSSPGEKLLLAQDEEEKNQEKIVHHWDGSFDVYLNSGDANRLANLTGPEAVGEGLIGVLSDIEGANPYIDIIAGATYLQSYEISYANADGNGIILYYTWEDGDAYSGYVFSGVVSQ